MTIKATNNGGDKCSSARCEVIPPPVGNGSAPNPTQTTCPYVKFRVRLADDHPYTARYYVEGLKQSFWWPECWRILAHFSADDDTAFRKAKLLCKQFDGDHGK